MNRYLWMFPFGAFTLGYVGISIFFAQPPVSMPNIVGMPVGQALTLLTEYQLNARVLAEKEGADLPAGTVLSQIPQQHQQIKKHQSVFLLLSREPEKRLMPNVVKKSLEEVQIYLQEEHIPFSTVRLASHYPKNCCIAQYPAAYKPLEKEMILYVSSGDKKPVIWPNVTGLRLEEALDILSLKDIEPELFGDGKVDMLHAYVVGQQPLAGTIVTLHEGRAPRVQLTLGAQ